MISLGIDTLDFMWQVEVSDAEHTLSSMNGPFHLMISPLVPPLVPFVLEVPANNYQLEIQASNILDTFTFNWSESFNFLGDSTIFNLSFTDSLGYVNNDNGTSLFMDTELFDTELSFTHLDLYRKMDSLSISNASISWLVSIHDSANMIVSDNGPFNVSIQRDIIDLEAPFISFGT